MGYDSSVLSGYWALVLGASSGFGEAVSLKLAECGMNIAGVHLDRKATLPNVERIISEIDDRGCEALFFNVNAGPAESGDDDGRHGPQPGVLGSWRSSWPRAG